MMDAKVIREQAIKEAKSALILNAARKVFAEMGFFEARLEDIAIAAGFSKAALYSYYADKEEIFLSLAIRDLERLHEQIATTIDLNGPFLSNLEKALFAVFNFFGENFALLLSVANFQTMCNVHREKFSDKHRQMFAELPIRFDKIVDLQVEMLKAARLHNEIHSEVADRTLANYMSALIRGILFQWKMDGKMGDAGFEIRRLVSFITQGLRCPAPSADGGIA